MAKLVPKILVVETTGHACSVAANNGNNVADRFDVAPQRHTELILPMIDEVLCDIGLKANELDAIAYGAGPGSFTGVRIATAIAQGLALPNETPLIPLSCLEILATSGVLQPGAERFLPIIDARRGEVYWGAYQRQATTVGLIALRDDTISDPADIVLPDDSDYVAIGTGAVSYEKTIIAKLGERVTVNENVVHLRAADALALAAVKFANDQIVAPELATPVYFRKPV